MSIQFSIYTCQPIPTAAPSPDLSSIDSGVWSPLSCTLIYTPTTAILVDCPPTIAATAELASWVKSVLPEGCDLKYFIASHAHGDHFFGFPILKDAFPTVTAIATKSVVDGVGLQYTPELYDGLWKACFPQSNAGTGLPETRVEFTALPPPNEVDLDGHLIKLYDVPHGDTHANSFVHVPELGLVVAGDLVYNGDCHQWLGEAATSKKRGEWIQGLSQISALKPKTVVPGHTFKPTSESNEALAQSMLKGTEEYIHLFEEELEKADSEDGLFKTMRSRESRWNLWILSGGCRAGIQAKQA